MIFKSGYKKMIGTFLDMGRACLWASLGEIWKVHLDLRETLMLALMLIRTSWFVRFPSEDSSVSGLKGLN